MPGTFGIALEVSYTEMELNVKILSIPVRQSLKMTC